MIRRTAIVALALVACGDNDEPAGDAIARSATLAIVAHPDDDLLFMQPDLIDAVRAGEGVTIVYVTAGDDDRGVEYALDRYAGLRAAYSATSGVGEAWRCGSIDLAGHVAEHCRLATVSLVFLGYPDGGKQGEFAYSLRALWEGRIAGATTVANRTAYYDRDGLVDALAAVIGATRPRTIRTLDLAATHGVDHSDHALVGALALIARARSAPGAELYAHRGYDVADEPATELPPLAAVSEDAFARYSACAEHCASCGDACPAIGPTYAGWLQRRYAIGFARHPIGALVANGACLGTAADGTLAMTECATPQVWQLTREATLRSGDRCVVATPDGALAVGSCDQPTPVTLDDEGHLWLGIVPPLGDARLDCIAIAGTTPRAVPCGGDPVPTWTVAPALVTTPRATIGLDATGRAVRLGDLTGDGHADLCAIDHGRLACAPGDGHGGFAPAIVIDDATAPLAIEPESLALGDIDGDGRPDACGRDAGGILCATASTGFRAARFTTAFAATGTAIDRSLAIVDAEVCGLDPAGFGCVHDAALDVRSTWPAPAAALWAGDLDGDRTADWCVATEAGPACGRAADREVSADGASWGFSLAGVVEGSLANEAIADPATAALADVDGDGRADLCAVAGNAVTCAPSQGRAFGPRSQLVALPSPPSALWLGDLDGDGVADACVDLGAEVACAVVR